MGLGLNETNNSARMLGVIHFPWWKEGQGGLQLNEGDGERDGGGPSHSS